jgi:glutathione S-transferase
MDKLFFSPGACSLAAMAALEEVGHPYEAVHVSMGVDGAGDDAYRAINPARQVPLLLTPGGPIRENAAIFIHLSLTYRQSQLLPRTADKWVGAASWMGFLCGTLHPAMRPLFRPRRFVGQDETATRTLHAHARSYAEQLVGLVADHLEAREWLIGARSAIDFYLFVISRWAAAAGIEAANRAGLAAHRERVVALPAMQQALARERDASSAP